MNKTKYSKILLWVMSFLICILIAIQFYLIAYIRKQQDFQPEVFALGALFVEIVLLTILLASSRVTKEVGSMAFTDVTGIQNKLAYQEKIKQINERKDTFSTGVIMFDLNNLKQVNDELGHEAGDHYIEAFSGFLSNLQGERIYAYRVGGDEFAMILEETNTVEVHYILDRLKKLTDQYNAKNSVKISYARGYEISTREHYYLMEELIRRADEQMYKHKKMTKKNRTDRKKIS